MLGSMIPCSVRQACPNSCWRTLRSFSRAKASDFATQKMAPEMQVELYINGKGPEHVFKAPLEGWDQNRLDLEQIMADYKLRALYAYSLGSGRGHRLLFNPRNGLSIVPYSGKTDSTVRLDGDPKSSLMVPIVKILVGIGFIGAMLACAFTDAPAQWIQTLRDASGGRIMLVICFVAMIILQISRQSKPRKRRL